MQPLFSVVLATRDRPALFSEALASVLAQEHRDLEVIVVNDGSRPASLVDYQPIWADAASRLGDRMQVHSLVHRPRGHGQSYSINFGVAQARGDYVCFLDDDDKWTDPQHLTRAAKAIRDAAAQGTPVDLFMANQRAWIDDQRPVGTLWLGDLEAQLLGEGRRPDADGQFTVTVKDLMATTGFCHLNCLVARRDLFDRVGGMDEGIRWECDRDIFLKLIEASDRMVHHPAVVSYHRVPDPKQANNMTTTLGMVEKRILQSLVLDRALARSKHPLIKQHARLHKGYALKKIATEFATRGHWADASFYAREALGASPGLKWLGFSLHCMLRSLLSRAPSPGT